MKMIALLAALVSVSTMAKFNSYNMTCSQAQNLVDRKGAVTIYVGNQGLYDRFVSGNSYCGSEEKTYRSRIKTKDNAKCILKTCDSIDGGSGRTITGVRRKCKDGQRAAFTEYDSRLDQDITVVRTCKNGRFYPYKPQPVPRKCEEGKITVWWETHPHDDNTVAVRKICRNGKWVDRK